MPFEDLGKVVSIEAGEDLSGSQYCCVYVNATGKVVKAGDGWEVNGILQNDPTSGQMAEVMVGTGITKVKAGAQTTLGSRAASGDTSGRAVNAATGDHIIGKFLEAAGTAGDIVTLLYLGHPAVL